MRKFYACNFLHYGTQPLICANNLLAHSINCLSYADGMEDNDKKDDDKEQAPLQRASSSLSINSDSAASGTSTPRSTTPASTLNIRATNTNQQFQSLLNIQELYRQAAENQLMQAASDPLALMSLGFAPMGYTGLTGLAAPQKPTGRSRGRPKKDSPKSPPAKVKTTRTKTGQRTKTLCRINAAHRQKVEKSDAEPTSTLSSSIVSQPMNSAQLLAAMATGLRTPDLTFVNPFAGLVPGLSATPFVTPIVPQNIMGGNGGQDESASNASESVPTTRKLKIN